MLFTSLYEHAADGRAKSDSAPVSVTRLADIIKQNQHELIEDVRFWSVEMDEDIMLAYVTEDFDRTSAYDETYKVLDIKYSDKLNFCWRRMVCCKELMHSFDTASEKTSTRERFLKLMDQLESPPMVEDFSKMLISEFRAEWMALIILCPKPLRDHLKSRIAAAEIDELQAATEVRVPRLMIRSIMSPYYDAAIEDLIR